MTITKDFNQYDKILFLLIVSLAFGGLGGLFQVSRLLSLVMIPGMLRCFDKSAYLSKSYLSFIIVFFIYAAISVIWAPSENETLRRFTYAFFHFLFFLEVLVFSTQARNPIKALAFGWLIAVCLTLVVAMWEITTDHHLSISKQKSDLAMMDKGIVTYRNFASVTFYNYNTYVTFLSFACPFLYYFLFKKIKPTVTIITIVALALSALVVTMNASRGGMIAIAVMLVVYFLFVPKTGKNIVSTIIVLLIIGYFVVKYSETIFLAIQARLVSTEMLEDDSRMDIWMKSLQAFANTGGLGVGIGGIEAGLKSVHCGVLATHNLLVEALLEFGLFGFISVFVFLWHLVVRSFKQKDPIIKKVLLIALSSFPVAMIIDSLYLADTFAFAYFASLIVFSCYDTNQNMIIVNRKLARR